MGDGGGGRDQLMWVGQNIDMLVHWSSPSLFLAPALMDSCAVVTFSQLSETLFIQIS